VDNRFDECLAFTLRAEGGYVDDPADPGGATNMGVTLATLREWSDDPSLGANQVQDMSLRTARAIYRALYWNPLRADDLPVGVDLSVFDFGVNAGIWHSARLLQRALGFRETRWTGLLVRKHWRQPRRPTLAFSWTIWRSANRHTTEDWPIFRPSAGVGSPAPRSGKRQHSR
jgi:hypothetical protein